METDKFTPEVLEAMLKQDEKEHVMSADEITLARALKMALERIEYLEKSLY